MEPRLKRGGKHRNRKHYLSQKYDMFHSCLMSGNESEVQKLRTELTQVAEEYQFLEQQQNELIDHMIESHENVKELSQLLSYVFDNFHGIENAKQIISQKLIKVKNTLEPILFAELGDKQIQINQSRQDSKNNLQKAEIVVQTLSQYIELYKSNTSNHGSQVQDANEQLYSDITKLLDKNGIKHPDIQSNSDIIIILQQLLKYKDETQTLIEAGENLKTALEEQLQCQNNNHLIIQDLNSNLVQQETAIQIIEQEKQELIEQLRQRDELIKRLQAGQH